MFPSITPTTIPSVFPTTIPSTIPTSVPTMAEQRRHLDNNINQEIDKPFPQMTVSQIIKEAENKEKCDLLTYISCCNPKGKWANTYMLGVCAKSGCHYIDNACIGRDFYFNCVGHCISDSNFFL